MEVHAKIAQIRQVLRRVKQCERAASQRCAIPLEPLPDSMFLPPAHPHPRLRDVPVLLVELDSRHAFCRHSVQRIYLFNVAPIPAGATLDP